MAYIPENPFYDDTRGVRQSSENPSPFPTLYDPDPPVSDRSDIARPISHFDSYADPVESARSRSSARGTFDEVLEVERNRLDSTRSESVGFWKRWFPDPETTDPTAVGGDIYSPHWGATARGLLPGIGRALRGIGNLIAPPNIGGNIGDWILGEDKTDWFTEEQHGLFSILRDVGVTAYDMVAGTFKNQYDPRNRGWDVGAMKTRTPALHGIVEEFESWLPFTPLDPGEYNPDWSKNAARAFQVGAGEILLDVAMGRGASIARVARRTGKAVRRGVRDVTFRDTFDFEGVDPLTGRDLRRLESAATVELNYARRSGFGGRGMGSVVADPETGRQYVSTAAHFVVGKRGEPVNFAGIRARTGTGEVGTVRGVSAINLEQDIALLEVTGLSGSLDVADLPLSSRHTLLGRSGIRGDTRIIGESGADIRTSTAAGIVGESGAPLIAEGRVGGVYLGTHGKQGMYAPGSAVRGLFSEVGDHRVRLGRGLSQRALREGLHYRGRRGDPGIRVEGGGLRSRGSGVSSGVAAPTILLPQFQLASRSDESMQLHSFGGEWDVGDWDFDYGDDIGVRRDLVELGVMARVEAGKSVPLREEFDLAKAGRPSAPLDIIDETTGIEVEVKARVVSGNVTEYRREPFVVPDRSQDRKLDVENWSWEDLRRETYYGDFYRSGIVKDEMERRVFSQHRGAGRERVVRERQRIQARDVKIGEEEAARDVEVDVGQAAREMGMESDFQEGLYLPIENPNNPVDYQDAYDPLDYAPEMWEADRKTDLGASGALYEEWTDVHGDFQRTAEGEQVTYTPYIEEQGEFDIELGTGGTLEGGFLESNKVSSVEYMQGTPSGLQPETQRQISNLFGRVIERGEERRAIEEGSSGLRRGIISEQNRRLPGWREWMRIAKSTEAELLTPDVKPFYERYLSAQPQWWHERGEVLWSEGRFDEFMRHVRPTRTAAMQDYFRVTRQRRDRWGREEPLWKRQRKAEYISDYEIMRQGVKQSVVSQRHVATPPAMLDIGEGVDIERPVGIRRAEAAALERPRRDYMAEFREEVLRAESGEGAIDVEKGYVGESPYLWHSQEARDFERLYQGRKAANLASVRDRPSPAVNVLQWQQSDALTAMFDRYGGTRTSEANAARLRRSKSVRQLGYAGAWEDARRAERQQAILLGIERGRTTLPSSDEISSVSQSIAEQSARKVVSEKARVEHEIVVDEWKMAGSQQSRWETDPVLVKMNEEANRKKRERARKATLRDIEVHSFDEDVFPLDVETPRGRLRNFEGIRSERTYGLELEILTDLSRAEMRSKFSGQIGQGLDIVSDETIKTARSNVTVEHAGDRVDYEGGWFMSQTTWDKASDYLAYRSQYRDSPGYEDVSPGDFEKKYAHEVVFPVMRGQQGLNMIGETFDKLSTLETELNTSMGMHVHVGAQDLSNYDLMGVWSAFAKKEKAIDLMHAPSRRGQGITYAESMLRTGSGSMSHGEMVDVVQKYGGRILSEQERVKSRLNYARSVSLLSSESREGFLDKVGYGDRYQKLNLRGYGHKTIEYRQPAATLDVGEVEQHIGFITDFVDEYAGKPVPWILDQDPSLKASNAGLDLVFERPSQRGQLLLPMEVHSSDFLDDIPFDSKKGVEESSVIRLSEFEKHVDRHGWFYRSAVREEDTLGLTSLDYSSSVEFSSALRDEGYKLKDFVGQTPQDIISSIIGPEDMSFRSRVSGFFGEKVDEYEGKQREWVRERKRLGKYIPYPDRGMFTLNDKYQFRIDVLEMLEYEFRRGDSRFDSRRGLGRHSYRSMSTATVEKLPGVIDRGVREKLGGYGLLRKGVYTSDDLELQRTYFNPRRGRGVWGGSELRLVEGDVRAAAGERERHINVEGMLKGEVIVDPVRVVGHVTGGDFVNFDSGNRISGELSPLEFPRSEVGVDISAFRDELLGKFSTEWDEWADANAPIELHSQDFSSDQVWRFLSKEDRAGIGLTRSGFARQDVRESVGILKGLYPKAETLGALLDRAEATKGVYFRAQPQGEELLGHRSYDLGLTRTYRKRSFLSGLISNPEIKLDWREGEPYVTRGGVFASDEWEKAHRYLSGTGHQNLTIDNFSEGGNEFHIFQGLELPRERHWDPDESIVRPVDELYRVHESMFSSKSGRFFAGGEWWEGDPVKGFEGAPAELFAVDPKRRFLQGNRPLDVQLHSQDFDIDAINAMADEAAEADLDIFYGSVDVPVKVRPQNVPYNYELEGSYTLPENYTYFTEEGVSARTIERHARLRSHIKKSPSEAKVEAPGIDKGLQSAFNYHRSSEATYRVKHKGNQVYYQNVPGQGENKILGVRTQDDLEALAIERHARLRSNITGIPLHIEEQNLGYFQRLKRWSLEQSQERSWGGVTSNIARIAQDSALINAAASLAVEGVRTAFGHDLNVGSFIHAGGTSMLALGVTALDRQFGSRGVLPEARYNLADLGDAISDVPLGAEVHLQDIFRRAGAGTSRWGRGSLSRELARYDTAALESMFGESGTAYLREFGYQTRRFGQRSYQTQRDLPETLLGIYSGDIPRARRYEYDPQERRVNVKIGRRWTFDRLLEWGASESPFMGAWAGRREFLRENPSKDILHRWSKGVIPPLQAEDVQPHIGYMMLPEARGIGRFFGRYYPEPDASDQLVKNWSLENIARGVGKRDWADRIADRKEFRRERASILELRRESPELYQWQDSDHFYSEISNTLGIDDSGVSFGSERLGSPYSRFGRHFSRLPQGAGYPLGVAGAGGAGYVAYKAFFGGDDEELRLDDPAGYSLSPRYPILGAIQRTMPYRRLRARGERFIDDVYGEGTFDAEMMQSMVIGKKGLLPKDVKETFVNTGRVDALVLSGMHVGLFGGVLRRFPFLGVPAAVSVFSDFVNPPENEVVEASSQEWSDRYKLSSNPWIPRFNPQLPSTGEIKRMKGLGELPADYEVEFSRPWWGWWDPQENYEKREDQIMRRKLGAVIPGGGYFYSVENMWSGMEYFGISAVSAVGRQQKHITGRGSKAIAEELQSTTFMESGQPGYTSQDYNLHSVHIPGITYYGLAMLEKQIIKSRNTQETGYNRSPGGEIRDPNYVYQENSVPFVSSKTTLASVVPWAVYGALGVLPQAAYASVMSPTVDTIESRERSGEFTEYSGEVIERVPFSYDEPISIERTGPVLDTPKSSGVSQRRVESAKDIEIPDVSDSDSGISDREKLLLLLSESSSDDAILEIVDRVLEVLEETQSASYSSP